MSSSFDPKSWQTTNSDGFFRWLEDVRPQVKSSKGGYTTFVPGPRERAEIKQALDGDYRTIVFCWPRRHGKTLVSALIIVWRFLTRKTQNIAIVANSEKQVKSTAFNEIASILKNTAYTAKLVKAGSIQIQGEKIMYDAPGNLIQGYSANPAALFGKKLSIAQCSELHAARDDAAYQALASATIDSEDGLTLVDSTVGAKSSPLYALFNLAQSGGDPSLFYSHIYYGTLETAVRDAPPWISVDGIKSRHAQMLPAEFAQQHLNLWQSSTSALFPPEVLDKCEGEYRLDVESIADGRAHVVGAGLDRAFGFSLHGDRTITSCVLKVLESEEEHFYLLASDNIRFSSAAGIKKQFKRYLDDYGITRATLESYNSQDIGAWCADQSFDSETVHATSERQANAFTALYSAAAEGRLHIAPEFEEVFKELADFEYTLTSGGNSSAGAAKFGGAKGTHDDRIYSFAWAVYSLRDDLLNPYEIEGIHCHANDGHTAPLCALNGGDFIPPCADSCRSMLAAHGLYTAYTARGQISPDKFETFIHRKLVNIGSHTTPR